MEQATPPKPLSEKPCDVIGRYLIAVHPEDWLALIGVTDAGATPVEVIDADLATLVPQADRVLLRAARCRNCSIGNARRDTTEANSRSGHFYTA